jgi:hypothetical protein
MATTASGHARSEPDCGPLKETLHAEQDRGTIDLVVRQERSVRTQTFYARLATDSWTRRDAFKLRHLCYESEGYIEPRPQSVFSDEYDFGDRSQTLVLYDGVEAIGSVRICTALCDKGDRLPLAQTFPEEFQRIFQPENRVVEINRLVCHPGQSQNKVVFALIRMADYLIREIEPSFIGICVRTNHVGFWKRLRFENVAGPRNYQGLKFATNFMALPADRCDLVRRVIPMLRISESEAASYRQLFRDETVKVFADE